MAQTLWERLVYGAPTHELYNPLQAKIDIRFSLDLIDYRDHLPLRLVGLTEYTRTINSSVHKFTDYHLTGHKDVRLRVMPQGGILRSRFWGADGTYSIYLLTEDGVEQWNEQLHQVLTDNTGTFVINQEGREDVYIRVNNLTEPYAADLKELLNSTITQRQITYWDFSREVKDVADQAYTELLFVELDDDSKQFTFWLGQEVDTDRVVLL